MPASLKGEADDVAYAGACCSCCQFATMILVPPHGPASLKLRILFSAKALQFLHEFGDARWNPVIMKCSNLLYDSPLFRGVISPRLDCST